MCCSSFGFRVQIDPWWLQNMKCHISIYWIIHNIGHIVMQVKYDNGNSQCNVSRVVRMFRLWNDQYFVIKVH